MTETTKNLFDLSLDQLAELADTKIGFETYLPHQWEWETLASQLATATAKIVHRYFNDWDEYTKRRCEDELWTFANRIHNHCFKLKRNKDYERNLKYLIINTLFIIDSLADKPKEWSIYSETGTRLHK